MERTTRSRPMRRLQKVRRVACPDCGAASTKPCVYPDGEERSTNHIARVKAHGRAYPAVPRPVAPPGVRAWHDTTCARCDRPITRHENQVVERKGHWIHTACAPGADDE